MSDDAASLAPVLLVSMPQMVDPNFSRSVILLAEYGANGAFGLILNRQMAEPAMEVVRAEPPLPIRPDVHLFVGGPVEPTRAWVLLADKNLDGDAMEVSDGVYLSASPELIRHTLSSAPDPAVRIVVGYAGWAAGQLETEIKDNSWLNTPVDRAILFEAPVAARWEAATRLLGVDVTQLTAGPAGHA